ncbi:hypothetical protein, partial [Methylobacterium indicum]|uniref:hypothetical protein n=1 Tax=Methylobacterium indicum TaxID=1775910 RepID=UPI001AD91FEA
LDPGSPSANAPVVRERGWNARLVASTFFNVVYRGHRDRASLSQVPRDAPLRVAPSATIEGEAEAAGARFPTVDRSIDPLERPAETCDAQSSRIYLRLINHKIG